MANILHVLHLLVATYCTLCFFDQKVCSKIGQGRKEDASINHKSWPHQVHVEPRNMIAEKVRTTASSWTLREGHSIAIYIILPSGNSTYGEGGWRFMKRYCLHISPDPRLYPGITRRVVSMFGNACMHAVSRNMVGNIQREKARQMSKHHTLSTCVLYEMRYKLHFHAKLVSFLSSHASHHSSLQTHCGSQSSRPFDPDHVGNTVIRAWMMWSPEA